MKPETIVAAATGIAVVGVAAYKGIRSRKGPRGSILLVGDSYAQGLGVASIQPPALASGDVDLDFKANGIPGSNSAEWAEVIGTSLHQRSWQWLVWSLGTNDAGRAPDKLRADIAKILDSAQVHRSGVAWIQPPRAVLAKVPKAEASWLEWRRSVGEGRTFDTDAHVKVVPSADGLHPANFRPWAEALWSWLAVLTA